MKREKLNEHKACGTVVNISRSCACLTGRQEFIPSGGESVPMQIRLVDESASGGEGSL